MIAFISIHAFTAVVTYQFHQSSDLHSAIKFDSQFIEIQIN